MICDWPHSLLDWDVLFLLPLPWWGPVLAPVLISLLMISWGTLATQGQSEKREGGKRKTSGAFGWLLNFIGVALALYVFMADTIAAAYYGFDAVRTVLPEKFNWPLFIIALGLMSAPMLQKIHEYLTFASLKRKAGEPADEILCKRPLQN